MRTVRAVVGCCPANRANLCQHSLDGILASASHPVQQLGTATHARYGHPGQTSTHALACTFDHEQVRAGSYGSEGWGFESLRARQPSGPDGEGQAEGQARWARGEPPRGAPPLSSNLPRKTRHLSRGRGGDEHTRAGRRHHPGRTTLVLYGIPCGE